MADRHVQVVPPPKLVSMPRAAVFLQDACYQHRYIRSRDTSGIVERPERLRAVTIGLAAAIARLEDTLPPVSKSDPLDNSKDLVTDHLTAALDRMNLAFDPLNSKELPVSILQSSASVDILNHPAVKFVHGDVDGDVYPEKLKDWVSDSQEKIMKGGSEIPEGLSQGDLYLCPDSINAIQGAIGTVCEAVDTVIASSSTSADQMKTTSNSPVHRAFVAIRPPGHHCGEDTPSGFCFVNNVAIGAAHAHLKHGINRIVILDIDLHHGNGTQSIVWQVNEETYRQTLEAEEGRPPSKPGLRIYYGSIHDILSYPCEDGKIDVVQAASVSLHGSHGQHIENIHLQTYTSEEHFWDVLYKEEYSKLLRKAEAFLDNTGGPGDDVMVFISCGMDACEHEFASMSRHNRKVPTSFYYRFARDTCAFSDRYSQGRLVSVLEGGYSDRALTSGAMAHLSGLVDVAQFGGEVSEEWWNVENLIKLEKAVKKRRGGRQSLSAANAVETWLERTVAIFSTLDTDSAQYMTPSSSRTTVPLPPSSMTLRERKKPPSTGVSPAPSPSSKRSTKAVPVEGEKTEERGKSRISEEEQKLSPAAVAASPSIVRDFADGTHSPASSGIDSEPVSDNAEPSSVPKKLPRVILRLGPAPDTSSGP